MLWFGRASPKWIKKHPLEPGAERDMIMNLTDIMINDTFKNFLSPLSAEEYSDLKNDIEKHGLFDPLIVWKTTLIDGHHRYQILKELGVVSVDVKEIYFDGEVEALEWMYTHQKGRRNLSKSQLAKIGMQLKESIKKEAEERHRANGGDKVSKEAKAARLNFDEPLSEKEKSFRTDEKVSEILGVSKDTYRSMELIASEGTDEQIQRMDKGGKGNSVSAIAREIKVSKLGDGTRICSKCGVEKPVSMFPTNEKNKTVCLECRQKRDREVRGKGDKSYAEMNKIIDRMKSGIASESTRETVLSELQYSADGLIASWHDILTENKELILEDETIIIDALDYLQNKFKEIDIKEEWING